MIGKIYKAPKDVIESGLFIVIGRDSDPTYNPSRKPWFLQVREYKDNVVTGPMISVTLEEFKKWNPDVSIPDQQRLPDRVDSRITESDPID